MTNQIITQDELKDNLHYDPDTGIFTWIKSKRGVNLNKIAGYIGYKGYINLAVNSRQYKAHRLAWLYVNGEYPNEQIDHINGIRSDNRIENLRVAFRSINQQNLRTARKDNKSSGYMGVSKRKGFDDYRADIRFNGKKIYLGLFKTGELAYQAYLFAKRQLHEGCQI